MKTPARRPRKAAGTRNGWDLIKALYRPPRAAASQADIAAIERGDSRTVACLFRGFAPKYPERFVQRKMDLLPGGLTLRPFWFTPDRHPIQIAEHITNAYVRPRDPRTDRRIHSVGNYQPGKPLGWAGFSVVVGETASGRLEFAVPNPDLPLFLTYIERRAQ